MKRHIPQNHWVAMVSVKDSVYGFPRIRTGAAEKLGVHLGNSFWRIAQPFSSGVLSYRQQDRGHGIPYQVELYAITF
jgi:hypothetical protein